MTSASDWFAKIKANVDDYYAHKISYDEFGRRNRALWNAITSEGKQDAVSQLISREQKAAGHFKRVRMERSLVTWKGVVGRELRRYSIGLEAWLLVETAPGVKVSWPEAEARPIAMAGAFKNEDFESGDRVIGNNGRRGTVVVGGGVGTRVVVKRDDGSTSNLGRASSRSRALRRTAAIARPSGFKPGDRVTDKHGLPGIVVGPGAAGERVIIEWDDGSSSNLSSVDLEMNGVTRSSPTMHARGVARAMASSLGLKAGDRIELLAMPDDPNPIPIGTKGSVEWANDVDFGGGDRFTQVGVRWDNGRSLMLSIPPDRIRRI